MDKFYYVTVATGAGFIKTYSQWAVNSLLKTGVSPENVHFIGKDRKDIRLVRRLCPDLVNLHRVKEKLEHVKWQYHGGKRKYSLFKSGALYKTFPQPYADRYMVYFDGDVLWYKNPTPFFTTKCEKTWFHHGKDLAKRASISRKKVRLDNIESLSKWVSLPMAHLMIKHKAKKLPQREVVSGLYLLHPRDHAAVLKLTHEGCLENADKFIRHEGAGEQKPMNAALAILNVDWHGGSRFFCPEHKEYFDHFFGAKDMKKRFLKKLKEQVYRWR
ncbi:hypothetical protein LCGC14_2351100 [marine sediment metagenome]|uniref:Nucleotide-diphospho-sugar transferase domain-containing protein n=1 Tax=marine sediment metagenome TaxID=412755 RepID=A0A0F9ELW8_9ZZZZ